MIYPDKSCTKNRSSVPVENFPNANNDVIFARDTRVARNEIINKHEKTFSDLINLLRKQSLNSNRALPSLSMFIAIKFFVCQKYDICGGKERFTGVRHKEKNNQKKKYFERIYVA